jgi:uncharacterized repeat protein (TIGR01451 family)
MGVMPIISTKHKRNTGAHFLFRAARLIFALLCLSLLASPLQTARAGVAAGYSEYYIPGASDQMWDIFENLDNVPDLIEADGLRCIIAVTAASDNTTIYYDHWENGYGFDPLAPDPALTADEVSYSDQGDVQRFESSNIPIPRGTDPDVCGATGNLPCYDGRDRIYVAGGAVTVTRASWPESIGTVFALSWEIYPTKPFMNHYTIPVGQNLAPGYDDFDRVYVIVQSTSDGNQVQIDDPTTGAVDRDIVLNQGGVTQLYDVNVGTIVSATSPVQVQFIVGQGHDGNRSEIRGYSAVPDALWDTEYYNPVGGFVENTDPGYPVGRTDLYLYNPHGTSITIYYEDSVGAGTFSVPANGTLAYSDSAGAGRSVPIGSGVYLRSDSTFWGIGSGDAESLGYDWGYSLVPAYALTDEYFLGWAPGDNQSVLPPSNGSPAFVTPVQNGTHVYVDYSPADGTWDDVYVVDRLDSLKIFDPDDDNTGMHIFASAPIAVAWGEDADTAETGNPFLDLGYTTLPLPEGWMDVVLGMQKSIDPPEIAPGPGNVVTITLVIPTYDFDVDDVVVTDALSAGWDYVPLSTIITLPGGAVLTGLAAEPDTSSGALVWGSSFIPATLDPFEEVVIVFQAQTNASTPEGINVNVAEATGTRDTQTFTAYDQDTVNIRPLSIDKDTSTPIVAVGGIATYTIVLNSSTTVTDVVISDRLPPGFTYHSGSAAGINVVRTSTTDPVSGATLLTWGTWNMGPGGTLTLTFSCDVNAAPGTYDNTALADSPRTGPIDDDGWSGQDTDTPPGQDPEQDEDVTVGLPTLEVVKDITPPGIDDNGLITYTIRISNTGPSTLDVVPLSDSFTGPAVYIGGTPLANTVDNAAGLLTWGDLTQPGFNGFGQNLPPGEEFVVTTIFSVTTPDETFVITNTAVVTGAEDIYSNPANEDQDDERITNVPTAVYLLYFRATAQPGSVLLAWETAVEIDNYGFVVLRSASGSLDDAEEIAFVPAAGHGQGHGAAYSLRDDAVQASTSYTYWLVDVDTSGQRTVHGLATATVLHGGLPYRVYLPFAVR